MAILSALPLASALGTVSCPDSSPELKEIILKKHILLILFMFILAGAGVFAQEWEWADKPAYRPAEHWWEYFRGFSLELEAGAHEYPLAHWYPDGYIDGYSIRSFYLLPGISYAKVVKDVRLELDVVGVLDFGAPDPAPGAMALSALSADRKDWYTIHIEGKIDWALSHLFNKPDFPGTFSLFLDQENFIYLQPDLPGGRIVDGSVEFGIGAYENNFKFGYFRSALGLPFTYLYRFNNDMGFGLNVTVGYKYTFAGVGMALGLDVISRTLFIPQVRQEETEFILYYDWKDFSLVLDVIAEGAFETASIKPELRYREGSVTYKIGATVSGLGYYTAFAPYLGMELKY
jgi:hypothetical protein